MPRSIFYTSCLALYVIAAIHVAITPTKCYGVSLAKREIGRESERIPSIFCGVEERSEHNAGLKTAQEESKKDDPQSSLLTLKPEDTLDTISLEAYTALVPELFACQFGSKGTIPELLEYLRNRPSFSGDVPWVQRIHNTAIWLYTRNIDINNTFKLGGLVPRMYEQVESDFDKMYRFKSSSLSTLTKLISLERYIELAHVVLGYPQYWHKELEHFLRKHITLEKWNKERGYELAYWTVTFFGTYEIKVKDFNLKSGTHEHLVQDLLKDLMKVFDKTMFKSKDTAEPSTQQVRSVGVEEHNEHNTGLKEAQVEREKDDTHTTFSLKPEDTLITIPLEAYASLVPELYRCRFRNKGTIPELLKYLEYIQKILHDLAVKTSMLILERNPPLSLPKDKALRKRIDNTRDWLYSKDIEINTSYKNSGWGPSMYRAVESDFDTLYVLDHHLSLLGPKQYFKLSNGKMFHPTQNRKAIKLFPTISLEMYLELAPAVLGYSHDWNKDLRQFWGVSMFKQGCSGLVWLESKLLLILGMQKIHFADGLQERGYKLAFWTIWFFKLHQTNVTKYDLESLNQETMAQFLMDELAKA
ncbi:hypothetical protein PSTT_05811, partial [Puccinia striiformis]